MSEILRTNYTRGSLVHTCALALLLAVSFGDCNVADAQEAAIPIKSGQSIAFLGDSITAGGWNEKTGYVHLIVSGLQNAGATVTPIPAGVAGNTSKDMLARLDSDVLSKKPDWMTLSCGVNDVWHGVKGVPLDQYEINITSIVNQALADGTKVIIMTATPIEEDPNNANNTKLAAYNDFLRQLAARDNLLLADTNAAMAGVYKVHPGPTHFMTFDGVHPIGRGNEVMAAAVLKALGIASDQIAHDEAQWDVIPDGWPVTVTYQDRDGVRNANNQPNTLIGYAHLTIAQYEALDSAAKEKGTTETDIISKVFTDDVKSLLAPTGTYASVDAIFAADQQEEVQNQLNVQLNQQIEAALQASQRAR